MIANAGFSCWLVYSIKPATFLDKLNDDYAFSGFEKYQLEGLKRHNELRAKHQDTPKLTLDEDLCKTSLVRKNFKNATFIFF